MDSEKITFKNEEDLKQKLGVDESIGDFLVYYTCNDEEYCFKANGPKLQIMYEMLEDIIDDESDC